LELEKLVKLESKDETAKIKLKEAIDKRDPTENMNDWRNALKIIDASLEQALTDDKITEWKNKKNGQDALNNLASVKTLLEKVCEKKSDGTIEKVKDDFITEIKKLKTKKADGTEETGKIDTLGKLIEKETPEKIIKLIHFFEYEKLDKEADQQDKRRKYS